MPGKSLAREHDAAVNGLVAFRLEDHRDDGYGKPAHLLVARDERVEHLHRSTDRQTAVAEHGPAKWVGGLKATIAETGQAGNRSRRALFTFDIVVEKYALEHTGHRFSRSCAPKAEEGERR
jgi:hypothetical protein